ncbi:hypothetical protein HZ994_07205 [Akkermansiaceae bacterium]|nr:hypothetical protein HZ994_07205 [Akkermansiaceae bacterium]
MGTYKIILGRKRGRAAVAAPGYTAKNESEYLEGATGDRPHLPDLGMAGMLRKRVSYFTDGAVIGSKAFVNDSFAEARWRFTERRRGGARRMRGNGKAAAGVLWSVRDLRVGLG